jgi:hypothetical protein
MVCAAAASASLPSMSPVLSPGDGAPVKRNARGANVVISQHPCRAMPLAIDEAIYKRANSSKTSSANAFAIRADKTDQSFVIPIFDCGHK